MKISEGIYPHYACKYIVNVPKEKTNCNMETYVCET